MSKRQVDWDSMPLGQVPDRVLAKSLGVRPSAVRRARKARDIPPMLNRYDIDWDTLPYGRYSDQDLANMYDVPTATVTANRIKAGIKRSRGRTIPPTILIPAGTLIDGIPVSWPKARIERERRLYE